MRQGGDRHTAGGTQTRKTARSDRAVEGNGYASNAFFVVSCYARRRCKLIYQCTLRWGTAILSVGPNPLQDGGSLLECVWAYGNNRLVKLPGNQERLLGRRHRYPHRQHHRLHPRLPSQPPPHRGPGCNPYRRYRARPRLSEPARTDESALHPQPFPDRKREAARPECSALQNWRSGPVVSRQGSGRYMTYRVWMGPFMQFDEMRNMCQQVTEA